MHSIDRFAYSNRIRKLDPAYKAGFSLALIVLCLVIDKPVISLIILMGTTVLAVGWAGLPVSFFLRLLVAEASFLAAGVLGIAVSLSTIPTPGGLALGPVWLIVTPESIMLAVRLLMRSLGCAAAMNFLALTTPLVDLIDLLRRLKVSELLIDLMTLIYRFVFTLSDCLERMILAQKIRMGFNGWRTSLRSIGQIGANLFIEAYRHSQRLQTALEGRGWEGSLHVLPQQYEYLKWPWNK